MVLASVNQASNDQSHFQNNQHPYDCGALLGLALPIASDQIRRRAKLGALRLTSISGM